MQEELAPDSCFLVEHPKHIFYLTGLELSLGILILTGKEAFLYVDGRYIFYARENAGDFLTILDRKEAISFLKKTQQILYEPHYMTVQRYTDLQTQLPGASFVPSHRITEMRMIKDAKEVEALNSCIDLSYKVWQQIPAFIHEGISEKELALQIEMLGRSLGADGISFDPIVAFGAMSAFVHHRPGNTKLVRGEHLLIDCGFIKNHYVSDMTRLFHFGPLKEVKIAKMEEDLFSLMEELIPLFVPGTLLATIQDKANEAAEKGGYGKALLHGFGHGVGMDVHEQPLSRDPLYPEMKLQEGMVLTLEPGFYVEGIGGVRVEEMILVEKKPKVLTGALSLKPISC